MPLPQRHEEVLLVLPVHEVARDGHGVVGEQHEHALLVFDAPTREFCTIRRSATNTPLQALVLWNDPQFVEAARALAQRANDAGGDDAARLSAMFVRCTQSKPDHDELARMQKALATFRTRFCAEPEAAKALLAVGTAPLRADVDAAELAALTMIANAILALDTTICTP